MTGPAAPRPLATALGRFPAMATAAPDGFLLETRGIGITTALREGIPGWIAAAFAALTHLGDTASLVVLAVLVYIAHDRRSGSFVIGALLTGFGVVLALKAGLALPRPPAELQFVAAAGYGFPSGHALGATVGWGAAALALEGVWTRRGRLLAAGAVAGLVSLSRLAIGVHYFVDVAAGVTIGLIVLAVVAHGGRGDPLSALIAAAVVALVAVLVTGFGRDGALLLGATVGSVVAWQVVEPADGPWDKAGVYVAAGVGTVMLTGLTVVGPSASLAFGAGALASVTVFLGPVATRGWLDGWAGGGVRE